MKIIDSYLESIITVSDEEKIETEMNVAGAVIVKEDENGTELVLLIQRAKEDAWPNFWEIPRGKCDNGKNEKIPICCMREAKEESGLDILPIKYIDKFSYIADKGTRKSTQYNFLCKMKDPNQKVKLSHEHQDYKWVSTVGEVELYVLPEIKKTISKVLNLENPIVAYDEDPLDDHKIGE